MRIRHGLGRHLASYHHEAQVKVVVKTCVCMFVDTSISLLHSDRSFLHHIVCYAICTQLQLTYCFRAYLLWCAKPKHILYKTRRSTNKHSLQTTTRRITPPPNLYIILCCFVHYPSIAMESYATPINSNKST